MSKEETITVLIVEPYEKPYVKEIDNTLESLQREVGGCIQAIYPFSDADVAIVADDEAKLKGKSLNRALRDEDGEVYDIIAGTFLIVGLAEDDFGSLNDEHVKRFSKLFRIPELFVFVNGGVVIISFEE